jgi:hypothetical protein
MSLSEERLFNLESPNDFESLGDPNSSSPWGTVAASLTIAMRNVSYVGVIYDSNIICCVQAWIVMWDVAAAHDAIGAEWANVDFMPCVLAR